MRESSENAPVLYYKWASADEDNLEKLKSKGIATDDTSLGRLRDTHSRLIEASYKEINPH